MPRATPRTRPAWAKLVTWSEWVCKAADAVCLGQDQGEGRGAGLPQATGKGHRERGGMCGRPGRVRPTDTIGRYGPFSMPQGEALARVRGIWRGSLAWVQSTFGPQSPGD